MADAYSVGGGGGRAEAFTENPEHALSKPYDLSWPLNADVIQQINEMLEQLFKSITKNSAAIASLQRSGNATWTIVTKTSDESANNNRGQGANVVADDADLQFQMAANTTYRIRGRLFFELDLVSSSNVLKHRFTGPASPTIVNGVVGSFGGGVTISYRQLVAYDTSNQNMNALTNTGTDDQGLAYFDILVQNGSNSGAFIFQWVSASSTANSATLRKGSYIEYSTI